MIGESLAVARRSLAAASANVSWIGAMAPMPAVATRSKPGPRNRVSDEEIVAAYHATSSTRKASAMAGLSVDRMCERLSRLGLKAKGAHWVRKVTDADLTAAYHSTSTISAAARSVGLSVPAARARLIALGLPSKRGRGRPRIGERIHPSAPAAEKDGASIQPNTAGRTGIEVL